MTDLELLPSFNLIKYTGHYVLTIDKGMGRPIIFQGEHLPIVLNDLKEYLQRIKTQTASDYTPNVPNVEAA